MELNRVYYWGNITVILFGLLHYYGGSLNITRGIIRTFFSKTTTESDAGLTRIACFLADSSVLLNAKASSKILSRVLAHSMIPRNSPSLDPSRFGATNWASPGSTGVSSFKDHYIIEYFQKCLQIGRILRLFGEILLSLNGFIWIVRKERSFWRG